MKLRPIGTEIDSSGTPSNSGIALTKPCQWMVCPSTRSGRTARPRFDRLTRTALSFATGSYSSKARTGALIWASPRCMMTWLSLSPVTSRNPKA